MLTTDLLSLALAALVAALAALLAAFAYRREAAPAVLAVFTLYACNYLTFFWAYAEPSPVASMFTLYFGALEGPVLWWLVRTNLAESNPPPFGNRHMTLPFLIVAAYPLLPAGEQHWPYILLSAARLAYAGAALRLLALEQAQGLRSKWVGWVTLVAIAAIALSLIKLSAYGIYLTDRSWTAPGWLVLVKTLGASGTALLLLWWALIQPEIYGAGPKAIPREPTDFDADILGRFTRMMEDDHLYLEENLNLNMAADRLAVTPRELSEAINRAAGKSFKALVRTYRVGHACTLLRDPANADDGVLEIALLSGFSTKSVFNTAFKAETGVTPSAYRETGPH